MTARWGRRRAAALDDDEGGRRSTGTEAGNARWGDGPEFLLACGRRIQAAPRLRSLDLGGRGVVLVGEEQRRGREAEEGRRSAGRGDAGYAERRGSARARRETRRAVLSRNLGSLLEESSFGCFAHSLFVTQRGEIGLDLGGLCWR